MPRMARVVVPGVPHHLPSPGLRKAGVTQRGSRREDVFHTDTDRQRYLALLAEWSQRLRDEGDGTMLRRLRQCTRTGRPAGGARFLNRLERLAGRRLRALSVGRPRESPKRAQNG